MSDEKSGSNEDIELLEERINLSRAHSCGVDGVWKMFGRKCNNEKKADGKFRFRVITFFDGEKLLGIRSRPSRCLVLGNARVKWWYY